MKCIGRFAKGLSPKWLALVDGGRRFAAAQPRAVVIAVLIAVMLLTIVFIPILQAHCLRRRLSQAAPAASQPASMEAEQIVAEYRNKCRATVATIIGGALLLIGLYYRMRQVEVADEGQITERFTRAIDQLGNSRRIAVRLGGIYALERIARDSKKDHWNVMEVLTAYVRDKAPRETTDEGIADSENASRFAKGPGTDIQAILTVIGRRKVEHEAGAHRPLDLSLTDLRWAILDEADLRGAYLARADLREANLFRTKLSGADLWGAELTGANFLAAHLRGAELRGVDLSEALMLTWDQVKEAHINDDTKLPPDLEEKRNKEKAEQGESPGKRAPEDDNEQTRRGQDSGE